MPAAFAGASPRHDSAKQPVPPNEHKRQEDREISLPTKASVAAASRRLTDLATEAQSRMARKLFGRAAASGSDALAESLMPGDAGRSSAQLAGIVIHSALVQVTRYTHGEGEKAIVQRATVTILATAHCCKRRSLTPTCGLHNLLMSCLSICPPRSNLGDAPQHL